MAANATGTLYVADTRNNQIRVFDDAGNPVGTWGSAGTGPGQFRFQAGAQFWGDLALGPDGNLYVLDTFNNRVQVLSPDGAFLREWGEAGSEEGQLALPEGIAVDATGRVYVADSGNARVQVFDGAGALLFAWQPPAADASAPDLADVAVDAEGNAWVTDYVRNVVYRFDREGADLAGFGETGDGLGQLMTPWGAAVDARGNLYVAEYATGRIQVFAPDGTSLGAVGSFGSAPGQFMAPIYVTVGQDGLLYVADESNRRVQVFRLLPPLGAVAATPVSA
jgi:DNA-binding beta-propeller fold protein YncE